MKTRAELETELELWKALGMDAASMLEEIARTRIPHTMTEHRAAEIVNENNASLSGLAVRFRELLDGS